MKKHNIIFIFALFIIFFSSSISYAQEDKTILIIVDKLDFETMEEILGENNYGAGFININTRRPYGNESLYFSLATGRKLGVKPEPYKGLYKNEDGSIDILGFEELYSNLQKKNNVHLEFLGEKLKEQGVSYIGEDSSAIIAANPNGKIKSGEIIMEYNDNWLRDKTNYHLSKSNTLVLSYEIAETKDRIRILRDYIEEYSKYNIIVIPNSVSSNMKYILNNSLVPVVYIKNNSNGLISSSSTKREGFVTIGDIYTEILSFQGETSLKAVGEKINFIETKDNLKESQILFTKTINLICITSLFHGIVYFLQFYIAYYIYKNKQGNLNEINLYNNFIIVNIFVSLLMGISSLHINILLYLFVNLLVTYIITVFITEKETDVIGLFATLTYVIILFGIFFYPKLIYNSYIGFNNLFYGARYYGFNNGIMGVLLITSIISYMFIEKLIENSILKNIVCILYFSVNMIVLSASYGTNTGGFITSVVLFLIMIYANILGKNWNIKNMVILVLIAMIIFAINMYFDYHSQEKSHAINFLGRIRAFGFSEFLDMFKIKAKELIKWTILPPFSIVIISQIFSLKRLKERMNFKREYYIIIFTAIVGFILNDTGMITFIYMMHYLIAMMIYDVMTNPSNP